LIDTTKLLILLWGCGPLFNTWFLGPTWRLSRLAIFAGLMNMSNRHSDIPRYCICSDRPHLAIAVSQARRSYKFYNVIEDAVTHILLTEQYACIP